MRTSASIFMLVALLAVGCNAGNSVKERKKENGSSTDFDTQITGKYWKLIKLEGQEIKMAKNQEREAFFTLKSEGKRLEGFAGCNSFGGSYILENGNRIDFSKTTTTLKPCPDVDMHESAFLKVFEHADHYTIKGDTLSLNVGRRASLAVFEAVYFN